MARMDVSLSDISSSGCGITGPNLQLAVGQKVVLRPEGLESLPGTIRWISETGGGIEFEHPLHLAVVDHLCRMHPDERATIAIDLAA